MEVVVNDNTKPMIESLNNTVINPGFHMVFGETGCDNSSITKNLVYNLNKNQKIDYCIVFTKNTDIANYKTFVPETNIFYISHCETILKIANNQLTCDMTERKNICMILDGIDLASEYIKQDKIFANLFTNLNFYKITIINCLNDSTIPTLSLKQYVDNCFIPTKYFLSHQESMFSWSCDIFDSADKFGSIFTNNEKDVLCLSVNNYSVSNSYRYYKDFGVVPDFYMPLLFSMSTNKMVYGDDSVNKIIYGKNYVGDLEIVSELKSDNVLVSNASTTVAGKPTNTNVCQEIVNPEIIPESPSPSTDITIIDMLAKITNMNENVLQMNNKIINYLCNTK